MTQVAVPYWKDRISPVFDTARSVLIFTVEGGVVRRRSEMRFFPDFPVMRVRNLSERGVSVLICGAISRRLLNLCAGAGLTVVPWICGPVDQVVEAYLAAIFPILDSSCRAAVAGGVGQGSAADR